MICLCILKLLLFRLVSTVSRLRDAVNCFCYRARELMCFVLLTDVAISCTFRLEYIFDFARMAACLDLADGSRLLLIMALTYPSAN
jgi:hypothetical protein